MKKTIISISLALLAIALAPIASAQSYYKNTVINGRPAYVVVPKYYAPKSYHYRTVRTGVCRKSGRSIYTYVRSHPVNRYHRKPKYTRNYHVSPRYRTCGTNTRVVKSRPYISIRF